nr:uncharacterized protein LOC129434999 [Misgurnus anguillicaudatus]
MSSFQEINSLTTIGAETFAYSTLDAERILFPTASPTGTLSLSVEDMKMKLIYFKKKEIRMKLHGSTLSEYWRSKRIPQGLRIQKAPTIGKDNEDFNKKWCEILNKCSMDLMLLIIEEVTRQKEDIEKDIVKQETLMKEKLDVDFTHICDSIKHTLKEFEDNLLTIKLKKYRRDAHDYQTGKVYKWLAEEETPRDSARGHHRQQFGFTSDSDFPSDSDSSRSIHRSQTRQFSKNDPWSKGRKSRKNKIGNQGRRGEDKRNGSEMGPVTRQQARVRS